MALTTLDGDRTSPSAADRFWQGKAALTFHKQGDRTLPEVQTQSPLKVQRPFYQDGSRVCQSVLLHTAGGMVGGDRLTYNIRLAEETHALITTAAAAKIYSRHPQPAQVNGTIYVSSGACLEWLPQEAIIFEGAQYHQSWRVDLAVDAHWLGWDILRLGRTARGERFYRGEVRSRFEVWQDGTPIWIDPQRLVGSENLWRSPHALKECPVIATMAWIGTHAEADWIDAARAAWETLPNPQLIAQSEVGVTRLQKGLLCRYRGHSTNQARRWFTTVWKQLRPRYAEPLKALPRVWQR
ncbi:urease accessory protein UreD [Oscillatoria sp. CS-180]|uniref:urease accessory protein UreD n=1 Tax=Oscillatoria sp. CS-180 TaxID=3021720 RepID=UPI00233142AF|nr:urease accessory protein UreD [Oscillatoria sp. CS-180]MDB9526058.1 urease accessory protein UreD [Oscillatoria sp. CS-180]